LAAQTGNQKTRLITELSESPGTFSYFQALKLIFQWRGRKTSFKELLRRGVRIRADVSLGFPPSDLVAADFDLLRKTCPYPGGPRVDGSVFSETPERLPAGDPETGEADPASEAPGDGAGDGMSGAFCGLTVTFMGLCGSASPLPPFYARNILADDLGDIKGTRVLCDLISYGSYHNHALAWFYSQLPFRLLEDNDPVAKDILRALAGENFGKEEEKGAGEIDYDFLGILSKNVRFAGGLVSYVSAKTNSRGMTADECVPRLAEIPERQRARLGRSANLLGRDAVLGKRVRDLAGKFVLNETARDPRRLESLMPGGKKRKKIEKAVSDYLDSPLAWDLRILVPARASPGVALGKKAGRLGLSAFLKPGNRTLLVQSPVVK
jgi:type VI secretion system protein ImpH